MAKLYQWRAKALFKSNVGPDTLLTSGAIPATQEDWQDAVIGEDAPGTGEWGYYFHDANVKVSGYYTDANASRVLFTIAQTWTTSVDWKNNLTVTVSSTINSIVRDNAVGTNTDTPGRAISIYQDRNSSPIFTYTDTQVAHNHTILTTPITLNNYSFTIAPGENTEKSALFVHNQTVGYPWYDEVWVGVTFRNILPADYRPGATLDTNTSIWKSHNRENGACHILSDANNATWLECRTIDGDIGGQGDPPLILHAADANSWYNQKLLGKE